jgi:hypothetical protein
MRYKRIPCDFGFITVSGAHSLQEQKEAASEPRMAKSRVQLQTAHDSGRAV